MYNRILTKMERTKEALAKKLDSIKSDVTNVNNSVTNLPTTLDSKFSALTSKVDSVKTDVASVGVKVDSVGSTLSGKVDGVGANVTAMGAKQGMIIIPKEMYSNALVHFNIPALTNSKDVGKRTVVLSVEGSGIISHHFFFLSDACSLEYSIDGKTISWSNTQGYNMQINYSAFDNCIRTNSEVMFIGKQSDATGFISASEGHGFNKSAISRMHGNDEIYSLSDGKYGLNDFTLAQSIRFNTGFTLTLTQNALNKNFSGRLVYRLDQ